MRQKWPELLSPAGNFDCARAAVAAGADAIYFGLPRFNARMRADNFTEADLPELMDYLHRHGVRGFVAMNTLIFTSELAAAEAQLRAIDAAGVDALIIQDLGLAILAHHVAPNVEIHASTQMTITSPEALAFIESLVPLDRAVLARELSIQEITRFNGSATPLEVFVHGALCVAYSGQCLTSESLGQRSANRGECAQACRMPYELIVDGKPRDLGDARYLLSPQDLAAVDMIPDLIRAGVKSLKIEGRLKSPEYVAAVTRVYRKALDSALGEASESVNDQDRYALEMTFSRGLSTGWLAGTNHPYLTHGRYGKKRGPFVGVVTDSAPGWIRIENQSGISLAAGDGLVFDAGENRDQEQGGRIWKIDGDRIIFHPSHHSIDFGRINPGQLIHKTSDPKLDKELKKFWQSAKPREFKIPLRMTVSGRAGEPLVIHASIDESAADHGIELIAFTTAKAKSTSPLETARQHRLDENVLKTQLGRLGGTRYELRSLIHQIDGDCHLALSALNDLRRSVIRKLEAQIPDKGDKEPRASLDDLMPLIEPSDQSSPNSPAVSVLCRNLEQIHAAIDCGVAVIYCDFEDPRRYRDAVHLFRSQAAGSDSQIFLATPRIIKPGEIGYLKLIEKSAPDGLLIRNLAALHHFNGSTSLKKIGDFSLNVANPLTADMLIRKGKLNWLTISYDLNIAQVLDLIRCAPASWFELTLHQHMPMFHMEHCVFCAFLSNGTSYRDCGRPCEKHTVHLRDRVGQLHRLHADVACRNTLFNGRAQSGARYFKSLMDAGMRRFRIELLDEDRAAADRTIRAYQQMIHSQISADELMLQVKALEKLGVTEGTLASIS